MFDCTLSNYEIASLGGFHGCSSQLQQCKILQFRLFFMLKKGDAAPDFLLSDQNSSPVGLSDFRGHKVLLYFYPKASTPGCTIQSCSVSRARDDFSVKGVVAIGISPDPPQKQKKFDNFFSLGFPLLCDTDHKVAESYYAWGEKSFLGKKFMGIIRSSFLIDENGIIIEAWYKVSPGDTVPNALNALT